MKPQEIRLIHLVDEKICIAVRNIDEDFVAIGASFTAPADTYSRKVGKAIASQRAISISEKPVNSAMIVDKASFRSTDFMKIWLEMHDIVHGILDTRAVWRPQRHPKRRTPKLSEVGHEDVEVHIAAFWKELTKRLDAEIVVK